jgi:signal transduction protein with GAF and PtsI domain
VLNARLLDLVAAPDAERGRFVDELARAGMPLADAHPPRQERNVALRGTSASTGIAIGPVYLLEDPLDLSRVQYTSSGDLAKERSDLLRALAEARRELDDVIEEVGENFGPEFASVFNSTCRSSKTMAS